MALENLIDFVKTVKEESLKSMIEPKLEFFMAITSINVSYFLKHFFHLSQNTNIRSNKNKTCSKKGY